MSLRVLSRVLLPALVLALAANTVRAEVHTETVHYQDGDTKLQGYLVWDDAFEGKRPGIIVVHEWWGLNDYVKHRAEMLAELGYLAFAVDMYGTGKVTEHGHQAKEWMQQITANLEAWQRRALLGLDILRKHERVDASRIAAIGYCFGGATVMQMAYAGADLRGVVSFHGSLPPASEEQAENIKASILVAHGSADAFVPAERVAAFQAALDKAGVDWEMDVYGGARHGFTNPDAGRYGIENVAYNEEADLRSWERMQEFLEEVFE